MMIRMTKNSNSPPAIAATMLGLSRTVSNIVPPVLVLSSAAVGAGLGSAGLTVASATNGTGSGPVAPDEGMGVAELV